MGLTMRILARTTFSGKVAMDLGCRGAEALSWSCSLQREATSGCEEAGNTGRSRTMALQHGGTADEAGRQMNGMALGGGRQRHRWRADLRVEGEVAVSRHREWVRKEA